MNKFLISIDYEKNIVLEKRASDYYEEERDTRKERGWTQQTLLGRRVENEPEAEARGLALSFRVESEEPGLPSPHPCCSQSLSGCGDL